VHCQDNTLRAAALSQVVVGNRDPLSSPTPGRGGRGRAKMKSRHGAVISFCGEVTRNQRPFQTKREVSRAFPFALCLNSRTERQKHGRRKPKKLNIAPESPKT